MISGRSYAVKRRSYKPSPIPSGIKTSFVKINEKEAILKVWCIRNHGGHGDVTETALECAKNLAEIGKWFFLEHTIEAPPYIEPARLEVKLYRN